MVARIGARQLIIVVQRPWAADCCRYFVGQDNSARISLSCSPKSGALRDMDQGLAGSG